MIVSSLKDVAIVPIPQEGCPSRLLIKARQSNPRPQFPHTALCLLHEEQFSDCGERKAAIRLCVHSHHVQTSGVSHSATPIAEGKRTVSPRALWLAPDWVYAVSFLESDYCSDYLIAIQSYNNDPEMSSLRTKKDRQNGEQPPSRRRTDT